MKRCYSEVVSLTLDEIALIRGALAKAELDNLEEQNINLYNDIRRSKVGGPFSSCPMILMGSVWKEITVFPQKSSDLALKHVFGDLDGMQGNGAMPMDLTINCPMAFNRRGLGTSCLGIIRENEICC